MDEPVIVCGGSLAGIATALRLHQHRIPVLVIERQRFPRPKLCGEFLNPDSFSALQRLDIWEEVREKAFGPIPTAYFFLMNKQCLPVQMHWLNRETPYALGISRYELDWILMSVAKARGIDVLEGLKVLSPLDREGEQIAVPLQALGPNGNLDVPDLKTRVLVDATGRHGGIHLNEPPTEQLTSSAVPSKEVGIQVHMKLSRFPHPLGLHMFFFPEGYGGLHPVSPDIHNLCWITKSPIHMTLKQPIETVIENTIARNPVAEKWLKYAETVSPVQTTAHLNLASPDTSHQTMLRAGDSIITVDPFTGSGMTLALQTGILAADCIALGIQREWSYDKITRYYWQQYFRRYGCRLRMLKAFRSYLFSPRIQEHTSIWVRPVLPLLTRLFR